MEASERPKEDVLNDVLGVLPAPEHPKAHAVDEPFESLNETLHCRLIAGHASLDQEGVGLDHGRFRLGPASASHERVPGPRHTGFERLFLNAFADDLPRTAPGVADRCQSSLDLLLREVPPAFTLGQPGKRQRQRQQVKKLFVPSLDV
jgi:hypothetical protein